MSLTDPNIKVSQLVLYEKLFDCGAAPNLYSLLQISCPIALSSRHCSRCICWRVCQIPQWHSIRRPQARPWPWPEFSPLGQSPKTWTIWRYGRRTRRSTPGRFCLATVDTQVCSLNHFYSVSLLQSRIILVEKCYPPFYKHIIKVSARCSWQRPWTTTHCNRPHLMASLFLFGSKSVARGEAESLWSARCQLKKTFKGLRPRNGSC